MLQSLLGVIRVNRATSGGYSKANLQAKGVRGGYQR